ncbi:MAG: hypothetical protein GF401_11740 [Chitinivibrionales bacterium]|nr:hypothetical protein [Chitinivibrionales bacterium]
MSVTNDAPALRTIEMGKCHPSPRVEEREFLESGRQLCGIRNRCCFAGSKLRVGPLPMPILIGITYQKAFS